MVSSLVVITKILIKSKLWLINLNQILLNFHIIINFIYFVFHLIQKEGKSITYVIFRINHFEVSSYVSLDNFISFLKLVDDPGV